MFHLFTDGLFTVTRAPTLLPDFRLCGTMHKRRVFVSDFAEKVDAILSCEERRGDRVHGCIPPTLFHTIHTVRTISVLIWGSGVG
jgi:hypothetical protein